MTNPMFRHAAPVVECVTMWDERLTVLTFAFTASAVPKLARLIEEESRNADSETWAAVGDRLIVVMAAQDAYVRKAVRDINDDDSLRTVHAHLHEGVDRRVAQQLLIDILEKCDVVVE